MWIKTKKNWVRFIEKWEKKEFNEIDREFENIK